MAHYTLGSLPSKRALLAALWSLVFGLLCVSSAAAESQIPVIIQQAVDSKVLFIIDDSNSMEAIMEPQAFLDSLSAVDYSSYSIPDFFFKINSGSSSPGSSHTVTPTMLTFQYGYHNIGLSSYGHEYYGNVFDESTTFGNIEDMPVIKSWVPTSTSAYVCLPNVPCSWSYMIGIANAEHYYNPSILGANVFATANLPISGTDAGGNEHLAVNMQENDYVLNYNWASYWPEMDESGSPIANNERVYSTTGHTVVFNGKEVFLSAGLYRERYLKWIFHVATAEQLAALPGLTRSQLVKDVMEMLILDNPQVKFGVASLNGSTLNAGYNYGYFSSLFYTPEGNNEFFVEPTIRAAVGADSASLISIIDSIGATSGTPLHRTYVEGMRYFDGDSSRFSAVSQNYTSPVVSQCDAHFMVLLTDGLPTRDCKNKFRNQSISDVDNDGDSRTSSSSCSTSGGYGNSSDLDGKEYSQYLDDAAKVANISDFNGDLDGTQGITSYAVGLGLDFDLLNDFAVNGGSGQSLRADTAEELTAVLTDIVNTIIQTPVAGAGFAMAESVGFDTRIYRPTFYQDRWKGMIDTFRLENGELVLQFDMGAKLESRSLVSEPRTIYAGSDPDGDGVTAAMIEFSVEHAGVLRPQLFKRYLGESPEDTTALADPLEDVEDDDAAGILIDYIHGIDANGLRDRDDDDDGNVWKLGDIIYSRPVEVSEQNGVFNRLEGYSSWVASLKSEPNLLVVGANDGMLHAFNAYTGEELWAYIPSNQLPELEYLARPDYNVNWHRYFVDGQILVQDVFLGTWKTLLIFGQRGGGSTYTVLDITDRENPSLLYEVSNPELYGESWNVPAVVKTGGSVSSVSGSEFNWYFVVGTGEGKETGGTNLVAYPLTSSIPTPSNIVIESASAAGTRTSGLGVANNDSNLDDDRAYIGVETGDLYRIEFGSGEPSTWSVVKAFNSDENHPITATPVAVLAENPVYTGAPTGAASLPYAVMVNFGTGRYNAQADIGWSESNAQRIVGIFDPVKVTGDDYTFALYNAGVSDLQRQNANSYTITRANDGVTPLVSASSRGFYIDLATSISLSSNFIEPVGMVTHPPAVVRGAIVYTTFLPNPESCEIGGHSFLEVVDFRVGGGIIIDNGDPEDDAAKPRFLGAIDDYNESEDYTVGDVETGIENNRMEVVLDAKVDSVDLSDALNPYQHNGVLDAEDIRLHLATGGILPAVSSLGNSGAPSSPVVSISNEAVIFQTAFATEVAVGDEEEGDDEDDGEGDDDNDDNKVTLCHVPPGNPNNAHTIKVSPNAVNAHLRHGDYLGPCNDEDDEDDDDEDEYETAPPGTQDFNVYRLQPEVLSFHEFAE